MNNFFKIIISGLIAFVISYLIYFFYGILVYSHSNDWQTYKQYLWIFNDSIKNDIDTTFSNSYVKENDVFNNFHYKQDYNVIIWDFKELGFVDLTEVTFRQNVNLDNVKFRSGEILNKKTDLEIIIKYGFTFSQSMNLNLDNNSKIVRNFEGLNYKGFYGSINKLSLSDEDNNHQIILDFTKGATSSVILLYKNRQSLYLIIIKSKKEFDESIISILNLS